MYIIILCRKVKMLILKYRVKWKINYMDLIVLLLQVNVFVIPVINCQMLTS